MSKAYSPTYCTSGFVLKSKLLHKSEAQHGFLQKLSHHAGENLRPSGSKTKLVHSGVHSGTDPIECTAEPTLLCSWFFSGAKRTGFLLFPGWNHVVMDGGAGWFCLGACTQGKAYCNNIRDAVSTWKKGFDGFCFQPKQINVLNNFG